MEDLLTVAEDEYERVRLYRRSCAIRAALSGLGLGLNYLATEIGISQSQLSKILNTYCHLKIKECQEVLSRAEKTLSARGATFLYSEEKVGLFLDCDRLVVGDTAIDD